MVSKSDVALPRRRGDRIDPLAAVRESGYGAQFASAARRASRYGARLENVWGHDLSCLGAALGFTEKTRFHGEERCVLFPGIARIPEYGAEAAFIVHSDPLGRATCKNGEGKGLLKSVVSQFEI